MATVVRKSIEIDVKADMKRLLSEFKKIPNMSKEEARKMVSNITNQLKRAEIAAKKTAKSTKKAGRDMATGFQVAEKQARSLRTQARGLSRTMSGLEDAVGVINPELEAMTSQLHLAAQGSRALVNGLASGNPVIIGLTVAVVAAVAAYTYFSSESKKAEEFQKNFNNTIKNTEEALTELTQKIQASRDAMNSNAEQVNRTVLEYQLLSGAISQAELSQLELEASVENMSSKLTEEKKKQLSLNAMQVLQLEAQKIELEAAFNLLKESENVFNGAELTEEARKLFSALESNSSNMARLSQERKQIEEENNRVIKSQVEQYREAQEGIQRIRKQQEEQRKAEQNREEARRRSKERLSKLEEVSNQFQSESLQIQSSIRQAEIQRMQPKEKINALYDDEIKKLTKLEEDSKSQLEAAEKLARTKQDRSKVEELQIERIKLLSDIEAKKDQLKIDRLIQLNELETKLKQEQDKLDEDKQKKLEQAREKLNQQFVSSIDISLKGLSQFASSGSQLIQNLGIKNKGLITALFRAQQAFAIGDIVMSTARAIARAPADYGPFAPFAIPAIAAGGAAQIAVVASQAPPEMHMGGMVKGEDTQTITALRGEAVLDRRTVNRLGGEEGINKLQRGSAPQDQIVVIQPYKHFDRYVNFSRKRGGSLARIAPKNMNGVY